MMKLNQPEINGINKISVINLINSCFDEMGNRPLREKLEKGINGLLDYVTMKKYMKNTQKASLCIGYLEF